MIFGIRLLFIAFTVFANEYQSNAIPYPKGFPLLERKGYSMVYDGRNKIPYWTQERLTKQNVSGQTAQRLRFKIDSEIYKLHQSNDADYINSGFDRGHMVPDADRDNTSDVLAEAYLFSNACPQPPEFNKGIWAKLENYARRLVTEFQYDAVDVISGGLFLPYTEKNGLRYVKYQVIGDNNVAVPTHFFKVMHIHQGSSVRTEVYILPTTASAEEDLSNYQETIEKLEKVSGLVFNHEEAFLYSKKRRNQL